jgi:hypothetical protein
LRWARRAARRLRAKAASRIRINRL